MIVFLIDKITPRWEYNFAFVFGVRGIAYQITTDDSILKESNRVFKIPDHQGRLLRTDKIETEINPKDLLSRLFFVLTRMEEYNPKELDHHQRFAAKESWQYKNDCLHQCICDRWALEYIASIEKEMDCQFEMNKTEVEIIPTFDIDNAFAYLHKTGKRAFLSKMKSIKNADFEKMKERKEVMNASKKDPFDGYDKIFEVASHFSTRLFWLVADYGGKDFNITLEKKQIKELVQSLSKNMKIGIHPSYSSNLNDHYLDAEIEKLHKVLERPIDISRQHFLKLRFPETYRKLIKSGIKEDYTMGFADEVGFRNGTAHPFPWFDLKNNETTGLTVFPFAYMDGTLNEYLKLSTVEAKNKIVELYKEVEQYGGQFSFIWHNETITDFKTWNGWSEVLDYTLTLKNTDS